MVAEFACKLEGFFFGLAKLAELAYSMDCKQFRQLRFGVRAKVKLNKLVVSVSMIHVFWRMGRFSAFKG
eukprot:1158546-Pelagomonas_calceolata.AAC.13